MVRSAAAGAWTSLLARAVVRDALGRARVVRGLHPVGEVGSTQDVALDLARDGTASGTLVVADRQTAGRGRAGRRWDDHPDGGTLALTLLLDVADLPRVGLVPHAFGLAVIDALAVVLPDPSDVRLKWPNDLVHRGDDGAARKLCGILVEREQVGARDVLLCGVGIDVDLRAIDVPADRTCLATLGGTAPERDRLLAAIVTGIDEALILLADPERLLARYRAVSDTIGREVRVDTAGDAAIVGRAKDVDEDGRLVVTTSEGHHAILSGTVRDAEEPKGSTP